MYVCLYSLYDILYRDYLQKKIINILILLYIYYNNL